MAFVLYATVAGGREGEEACWGCGRRLRVDLGEMGARQADGWGRQQTALERFLGRFDASAASCYMWWAENPAVSADGKRDHRGFYA
jgi:hypothetical protein